MKEPLPNQHQNRQEADMFRLLAHPARLAVLEILRGGEACVCHMEAHLGLRQAYLSQQLAVLREAGIISDRRDGWNIFYRVDRPEVYAVLDAAGSFLGAERNAVGPRINPDCPCPKCKPAVTNPQGD